jgi:hypothetical protein
MTPSAHVFTDSTMDMVNALRHNQIPHLNLSEPLRGRFKKSAPGAGLLRHVDVLPSVLSEYLSVNFRSENKTELKFSPRGREADTAANQNRESGCSIS